MSGKSERGERIKKKEHYMSDGAFSVLEESLEQALQHARGERGDFRVAAGAEALRRQQQQAAEKPAFLKRQACAEELAKLAAIDDETLAKLYAESAEEDCVMAEEGMADYVRGLEREDRL